MMLLTLLLSIVAFVRAEWHVAMALYAPTNACGRLALPHQNSSWCNLTVAEKNMLLTCVVKERWFARSDAECSEIFSRNETVDWSVMSNETRSTALDCLYLHTYTTIVTVSTPFTSLPSDLLTSRLSRYTEMNELWRYFLVSEQFEADKKRWPRTAEEIGLWRLLGLSTRHYEVGNDEERAPFDAYLKWNNLNSFAWSPEVFINAKVMETLKDYTTVVLKLILTDIITSLASFTERSVNRTIVAL
jgi:hypothetical protein